MTTRPPSAPVSHDQVATVAHQAEEIYAVHDYLTFHNWAHVTFVRTNAVAFAEQNGADVSLVEMAALVHDLNYVAMPNSGAGAGAVLRERLLRRAGVGEEAVARIEEIIREAEIQGRRRDASVEAQALSDADTLFKILPITPVLLSPEYMRENGVTIFELADKIVGEQFPILRDGYLFYNEDASRRYGRWAEANLELWRCIADAVGDGDVQSLMKELPSPGEPR